jgi:hypothetical protein
MALVYPDQTFRFTPQRAWGTRLPPANPCNRLREHCVQSYKPVKSQVSRLRSEPGISDLQSAALPRKLPENRAERPTHSPLLSPAGLSSVASLPEAISTDPELARLQTAWPGLSEPIRRAIGALVESG